MTAKWQYRQAYEAALEHNHELKAENAKLRELAGLLLYGMCHDAPPHEVLLWSQSVNRLTDELGIEMLTHSGVRRGMGEMDSSGDW